MKNVTYINASAGSGKTYTLTHQLAELVKGNKVKPDQVIMTTFTVKAAHEMKEAAKKVLYENGLFTQAAQLDQAMIGTIHSVANALIKKYWFFLGLSPDMGVMAEEDTKFYISQSLSELPTHDELKQLHSFCEIMGISYSHLSGKTGLNYDFWKNDIEKVIAYTTNYEIISYERSIKESLDYIHQFVHTDVKSDYTKEELAAILEAQYRYATTQRESKKKQDILKEIRSMKRGTSNPTIVWYKRLFKCLTAWNKCAPEAESIREQLTELWHWPLVYEEQERYIRLLFTLADRWRERFRMFKKERNLLDYNDMEKYLLELLDNKELGAEITMGYHYLFVDEYQDCSPIQVKIFDRLSELMEHSYWVGDYKQAIYGFRGSDITLTKAVIDRIATGQNGCEMAKPLDTSYRSLPDIVSVCNETFKKTFANVLDENAIVLKQHHKNDKHIKSLRYWDLLSQEYAGIPEQIAYLIQQGVNPSDIAVLGRTKEPLKQLTYLLTDTYGIPAYCKEGMLLSEMKATPLILALLALVLSDKDTLAKAEIAILTEDGYQTQRLIEERLSQDTEEQQSDYLNDVPLVRRLLALRPMLEQQSVSALVETMIIELDLFNEIKKIGRVDESTTCLNTIIQAGYAYEQHCLQMNLPATVNGFMDYLSVMNPMGKGEVNGVQLLTYHASKGLEWKYVILTQLNEKKIDPKKFVKKNIFGIYFNYAEQPSAAMPYPEVYIRVMPFIYGSGNTNVPSDIQQQIEGTPLYETASKEYLSEENRLLYVGMTRPREVLILTLESETKNTHALQWLEDVGLDSINLESEHDILGVGCPFEDDTLTVAQAESINSYRYLADGEKMKTRRIPYQNEPCEAEQKFVSPSSLHKKGIVAEHFSISKKLPQGTLVGKTMADVGNCIHQIFCGIEEHIDSDAYYTDLIESYGLKTFLVDHKAIRNAWEKLVVWLTKQYGPAINVYHERPFTLTRDGQVFTGSIDLVWQTAGGDVLIDFKTCPLGQKYILDIDSEHYAGWYAGQLDAYTDALEAAGEKVLKRYIYYPVSGMLCEIQRSIEYEPPYKENVFHIIGIDGLDINDMFDEAPAYCSDEGFSGQINIFVHDKEKDGTEVFEAVLRGASTQGVHVTYIHRKHSHIHIELPWLASIGDVKLAFAFMKVLREFYPKCEIYMDDNTDGQFDLAEDNFHAMVVRRLINMKSLVTFSEKGDYFGLNGFYREFLVPSIVDHPGMEIEKMVFKAFDLFVESQWLYADYVNAGQAEVVTPEGKKFTARMLTNEEDTFVGVCEHVCLSYGSEVKDIPIKEFLKVAEGHPSFKLVDAMQFVLKKMPDKEWKAFYHAFDVKPLCAPKTYLLRWNPAISSFKLDDYLKATTEYPEGFCMNWSVYEWEDAHEGDRFYMLRTGDDKAGIVFRGVFTSEPYPGDDWAGKGKQRYYMDMDCFDCFPADKKPSIHVKKLEKAIPSIDWRRGHSGQLLSKEEAKLLDEMWDDL